MNEYPKYVPSSVRIRYQCPECSIGVVKELNAAYVDIDKFVNMKSGDSVPVICPNCKKSTEIKIDKINNEFG